MIKINDISFSYQENQLVLNAVDLTINKGSLFGLLGPNGAGKSTLIALVAGLYEPLSGYVSIDGGNYSTERALILGKLAVVPQEYAFYLQLTVLENIQFFASLYQIDQEQVHAAMNLTGLAEHSAKLAKQLSGGLKRRLNLAIGLLNEPEILILDEPTVGIDPQSRYFILQAIKDINAHGTTIIYTSHYMEEIEQLCDEVAIMDYGKILTKGSMEEILASETHLEIDIKTKDDINNLSAEFNTSLLSYGLRLEDYSLRGDLSAETSLKDVLELLEKNNIMASKIRYGKQSLESLFFSLTHSGLRD